MESHVQAALFLYVPDTEELIDQVVQNPFGTEITLVLLQQFLDNPEQYLPQFNHVVIAAPLNSIKSVLTLAIDNNFSIGIITTPGQRNLRNCYGLPKKTDAALDFALQENAQIMDVILCNKQILVFKASIGRLPLINSPANINLLQIVLNAFKQFIGLKLLPFQFTTASGKNIKTAASGCMIVQHHERTLASKLISHDSCLTDGMISMVITAPISITDYFSFLSQTLRYRGKLTRIPSTIGYIKSSQITIETKFPLEVSIDGENITQTPLHCETIPRAVRINVGEGLREPAKASTAAHERIEVTNLPLGKELFKARKKGSHFFPMPLRNVFGICFFPCVKMPKYSLPTWS